MSFLAETLRRQECSLLDFRGLSAFARLRETSHLASPPFERLAPALSVLHSLRLLAFVLPPFSSSSLRLCVFAPLRYLPFPSFTPATPHATARHDEGLLLFSPAPLRLWCARKSLVDLAT